jgi:hypothetical protein
MPRRIKAIFFEASTEVDSPGYGTQPAIRSRAGTARFVRGGEGVSAKAGTKIHRAHWRRLRQMMKYDEMERDLGLNLGG